MSKKFKFNQNQLPLPFGEVGVKALAIGSRQSIFYVLGSMALASIFIYIYAVNASAHHIAVRENLEREVAEANMRLSVLEFAVIESRNAITLETARAYGFAEVKEPLYVSRSSAETLTLNTVAR